MSVVHLGCIINVTFYSSPSPDIIGSIMSVSQITFSSAVEYLSKTWSALQRALLRYVLGQGLPDSCLWTWWSVSFIQVVHGVFLENAIKYHTASRTAQLLQQVENH